MLIIDNSNAYEQTVLALPWSLPLRRKLLLRQKLNSILTDRFPFLKPRMSAPGVAGYRTPLLEQRATQLYFFLTEVKAEGQSFICMYI